MSVITELLVGLGIDSSGYDRGLAAAGDSADSFVGKITGTLGPAIVTTFAAGGAAAVAFAGTSIKAAGDFEAGMLSFKSVTGSAIADAGFSLDDFQAKFLELGAETAFSAAQAQEAAIELAKGGVAIPSIMEDATQATLDLASAGGLELAASAGIVAKQLGVWADTGITATQVSNLLAQAANASTVDVDELAAGLANAQGTAKTAGVEYDQLVTTMALLAPNFASASTAGTSLNNFLLRLQPTTTAATDAMKDLGLVSVDYKAIADDLGIAFDGTQQSAAKLDDAILKSIDSQTHAARTSTEWKDAYKAFLDDFTVNKFYDAQGAFIGMDQAAGLLQKSFVGLSEAEKTAALQAIFGNDAMGAAVALATAGTEGYNAMASAMNGAGTAFDQAAQKNQGLNFAFDSMLGSLETLQITIGLYLLPIITSFINDAIIPLINNVTAAAGAFPNLAKVIQEGGFEALFTVFEDGTSALTSFLEKLGMSEATAQTVNSALQSVYDTLAPLMPLIKQVGNLIADNWQPILVGVAGVLGVVVVSAIASFVASVATVAAPIVAAIAIGAAMYKAYTENFLGIQTVVTTVVNAVNKVITAVMTVVLAFWQKNGADILAFTTKAFNQILEIISGVLNAISLVVSSVLGFIADFWTNHSDLFISIATNLWQTVKGLFQAGLDIIQGLVKIVTGIISGDWQTFADGCAQVVTGLWTAIKTIFTSGFATLRDIINVGIQLAKDLFNKFADSALTIGRNIIQGIIDGVKNGVGALVDAVSDAAQSALDAAMDVLDIGSPSKEGYWIGDMFMQGPINAIYDRMADLASAGRDIASTLLDTATPGDLGASSVPIGSVGVAAGAGAGGVQQNFQIDAHYKTVQDEMTLRDRIRVESLLALPG